MTPWHLVIFDMDGTILYTLQDIVDGLNYALHKNGLPGKDLEEVRSYIGLGIRHEVECSVPAGTSPDVTDRVFDDFNAWYAVHCEDHTVPYEGIPQLLNDLRAAGILTAVVSNKGDYAVQELIRRVFPGQFDCGIGMTDAIAPKPAPDTVLQALKLLGIPREEAVYVGDSEIDIETARNAHMDCILVDYGYRSRSFLKEHGADTVVSSVQELYGLLGIS